MSNDTYLNGMRYQYEEGSNYSIYPVKGKHRPKDIQRVKFRIKKEDPSALIQIRWMQTEERDTLPSKIPENAVLKSLKLELGKCNAYIEELEEQLQQKKSQEDITLSKEEIKEALKDKRITELTKKNKKLQAEIISVRKNLSSMAALNQNQKIT